MPKPIQPVTKAADDAQTWGMFLLLAAIWGSSFMFIRIGLEEGVAPLTMVVQRTLFGALLLAAVVAVRGGRLPLRWIFWKRMGVLAVTNIAIPFALIAWGQQYIPSGMAAIINAMVPLFTIVLATLILHDELLTPAKLAGLGVGFIGVVVLALPSLGAAGNDEDALLAVAGMLAVAVAAVFYAIAAVYTRRRLLGHRIIEERDGSMRGPTPPEIALGSTVGGFLIISVLAMLFERPEGGLIAIPGSTMGWFAMIWLGALGTGLAYLLFFGLIERWGATRTTLVTYVIPIVAIMLGFMILGERLRLLELGGAALIIGGVALVNGPWGQRPLLTRSDPA